MNEGGKNGEFFLTVDFMFKWDILDAPGFVACRHESQQSLIRQAAVGPSKNLATDETSTRLLGRILQYE